MPVPGNHRVTSFCEARDMMSIRSLLMFLGKITGSTDEGEEVDTIYPESSKTFNSMGPIILDRELPVSGKNRSARKWVRQLPSRRISKVWVVNYEVESMFITSRAPHYLVIGPRTLLLLTSDLG